MTTPMADEVARRLAELHAELVADLPEGEHDKSACAQCATQEGVPVGKTYTEDELTAHVDAAVSRAVGDLRTQLADLQASQEAAAIEERVRTAVEAATQPLQAQVTELQGKLDAAELEKTAEKARADTAEAAIAEAQRSAEIATRTDARIAKVKEAVGERFGEDYLKENATRWAEMTEEAFEAQVKEYAALIGKGEEEGDDVPTTSALQATTTDTGAGGRQAPPSPVKALMALGRQGIDVRQL